MSSPVSTNLPDADGRAGAIPALWAASALVLAAALLASFRQAFAGDVATLLAANGPRVLFGAAVGAAFALSGALRMERDPRAAPGGLRLFAASSGAAAGAFAGAEQLGDGAAAWIAAAVGAVAGGGLLYILVRAIERPARSRWTNFAAAGILAAGVGIAALAGSYARERTDGIATLIAWLLGDLSGATTMSGLVLLVVVGCGAALAVRELGSTAGSANEPRLRAVGAIALGLGVGAAGPLAFVAQLIPRVVRLFSGPVSPSVFVATCAVAGAASVVAVDAVPRLLVGGYDFPFNVPAAMVATPVFLLFNRVWLRARVGRSSMVFEALEVTTIVGLALVGTVLAATLARVIAAAT